MSKARKLRGGKYKVMNWPSYNKSLKDRGSLTAWFTQEGINKWLEEPQDYRSRGRQNKYSDISIKMMYILRQIFNLRLRQTEGFVSSILEALKIKLPTPDYTTISRRIRNITVDFMPRKPIGPINLILDSSGIKVLGEKEWCNYKYGLRERRIWRKLHIGVTDDGSIVAREVTPLRTSDIATVPVLLKQIDNKVDRIVADGAYYRKRMIEYMDAHLNTQHSKFIGPPRKGCRTYRNRLKVEETFSRYKRIIGNKFKAVDFLGQQNEAKLSLFILNKMKDIGMPLTIRVA